MIVQLKDEFRHDYPEIDSTIWYEVKLEVLDKVVLGNDRLYLRRKFDTKPGDLPR